MNFLEVASFTCPTCTQVNEWIKHLQFKPFYLPGIARFSKPFGTAGGHLTFFFVLSLSDISKQDPLALPYALAIERFCSRGSGADLYHLKSEELRTPERLRVVIFLLPLRFPVGENFQRSFLIFGSKKLKQLRFFGFDSGFSVRVGSWELPLGWFNLILWIPNNVRTGFIPPPPHQKAPRFLPILKKHQPASKRNLGLRITMIKYLKRLGIMKSNHYNQLHPLILEGVTGAQGKWWYHFDGFFELFGRPIEYKETHQWV